MIAHGGITLKMWKSLGRLIGLSSFNFLKASPKGELWCDVWQQTSYYNNMLSLILFLLNQNVIHFLGLVSPSANL